MAEGKKRRQRNGGPQGVMAANQFQRRRMPVTEEEWEGIVTPIEREFVAAYFANGNATAAARAVAPDAPNPGALAYNMRHRQNVQLYMQYMMAAVGITPFTIAENLADAMFNSEKLVINPVTGKRVSLGPDYLARNQATAMAMKAWGVHEPPKPEETAKEDTGSQKNIAVFIVREAGSLSGARDPFIEVKDVTPEGLQEEL